MSDIHVHAAEVNLHCRIERFKCANRVIAVQHNQYQLPFIAINVNDYRLLKPLSVERGDVIRFTVEGRLCGRKSCVDIWFENSAPTSTKKMRHWWPMISNEESYCQWCGKMRIETETVRLPNTGTIQTPNGPVEVKAGEKLSITSEGEVVVDERPSSEPVQLPIDHEHCVEMTRGLLVGFFRLVRVLQVIERGARWTAEDLEAELSKAVS